MVKYKIYIGLVYLILSKGVIIMKKIWKESKFFKEVFSSRKTKIAFFACLLSCLMLLSVTFAWFYNIITLPQNRIETGSISYVVKGYDVNGNFISTIIDPEDITKDTVNPNEPLFNLSGIGVNEYTTAYISIETTGTLDLEYALNFKVKGSEEDMLYIGGLWFKIEELDELPPYHPDCECEVIYYIDEEKI